MSDERAGLPLDWEIVAKGWTAQEVFEFLVRERRLKPAAAIAEMNGRGRILKWQIVRLGNFRYSDWPAPVGLFPKHMWDLAGEGRVIIFPSPSSRDLCWDETRPYGSRGRWPSHPSAWSCLTIDGKVPPAELTFMTFQEQVRQLWPPRRNTNAGDAPDHDWEEAILFFEKLWKERGDPKDPQNHERDWKSDSDIARAVQKHLGKHGNNPEYGPPDDSTVRTKLRPILKKLRNS